MRLTIRNCIFSGRSPVTIVGGPRLAPLFIIAAIAASAACAAPWSTATANTVVSRYPDPDIFHWPGETNHFSWQAGYMMFVFEKLWRLTGDETYFNYVKKYVDQQVDNSGNIPDFVPNQLDNFLPGYAIVFMYEKTGLQKYKTAAQRVRSAFNTYPRTGDGGFYHSTTWAARQMWVDGVFMGQMFLARYAKSIGDSAGAFDEVYKQMNLIVGHCRKPNGLLLHAWDESKSASWANRSTGLAPCVWSEGLGWFACLIADVFDFLPADRQETKQLLAVLQKLCAGLKSCQDTTTGMWCQVVDSVNGPGNWNETSGTGQFLYLIKKSIDKGYIPAADYAAVVSKAFQGLQAKGTLSSGLVDVKDCSSIGVQNSYSAYVGCRKETNTYSGIASFILGTSCMEWPVSGTLSPREIRIFRGARNSLLPEALERLTSERHTLLLRDLAGRVVAYSGADAAMSDLPGKVLTPGAYVLTAFNGRKPVSTFLFLRR